LHQLQSISNHVRELLHTLEGHHDLLSSLVTQYILSPSGLTKIQDLLQLISNKSSQLKVWENLLSQASHSPLSEIVSAHLVISSQPFPMVVAKGKQFDGNTVELSLVVGGGVKLESCSNLFVECVEVAQGEGGPSSGQQQQSQQLLEEVSLGVTLEQLLGGVRWPLRFAAGTRRNLIRCRFMVTLRFRHRGELVNQDCVSELTPPFVVITNECQWDDCEGDLLSYLLFSPNTSTSWPSVVNALQRFVLRATRQQQSISCFLSRMTIQQINARFFGGRSSITTEDFSHFWKWFGKSMHKLRYQRHLCSLWLSGFFHLILARESVNQILSPHPPGVFLVRFSESSPGHIVISYKTDNPNPSESIRHYLLSPADLAGTKKSLPDFLFSQKSLVFIYQQIVGQNGHTSNKFYRKEEALDPYLNKKPNKVENSGRYDKKLM